MPWQALADAVLSLHVAVVAFVVGGLACIVVGNLQAWRWVNGCVFRVLHLGAIGTVAALAWLGEVCPLTTLEMALRTQARASTYPGGFIEHWLQRLLYFDAPGGVFTLAYTVFCAVVAACWWHWPPRCGRRSRPARAPG